MKLLLDQGLPRGAAAILRTAGIQCVHVGEIGLSAAEDAQILRHAALSEAMVITLDADFHSLLALSRANGPSVIRVRIEGLKAEALSVLIQTVIAECGTELDAGAMVTVTVNRIRIHRLPMGR